MEFTVHINSLHSAEDGIPVSMSEPLRSYVHEELRKTRDANPNLDEDQLNAIMHRRMMNSPYFARTVDQREDKLIVGVLGDYDRGKSWVIHQLMGAQGHHVKKSTSGLTFILPAVDGSLARKIIFLDAAGQSAPIIDKKGDFEKEQDAVRDKLSTEAFIRDVVIKMSDLLLVVVDRLQSSDQALIEELEAVMVAKAASSNRVNESAVKLCVVHNYQHLTTKEEIYQHWQRDVQRHYKGSQKCYKDMTNDIATAAASSSKHPGTPYFEEREYSTNHVLFAKEGSLAGNLFNRGTVDLIKNIFAPHHIQHSPDLITALDNALGEVIANYLVNPGKVECRFKLPEKHDLHKQLQASSTIEESDLVGEWKCDKEAAARQEKLIQEILLKDSLLVIKIPNSHHGWRVEAVDRLNYQRLRPAYMYASRDVAAFTPAYDVIDVPEHNTPSMEFLPENFCRPGKHVVIDLPGVMYENTRISNLPGKENPKMILTALVEDKTLTIAGCKSCFTYVQLPDPEPLEGEAPKKKQIIRAPYLPSHVTRPEDHVMQDRHIARTHGSFTISIRIDPDLYETEAQLIPGDRGVFTIYLPLRKTMYP